MYLVLNVKSVSSAEDLYLLLLVMINVATTKSDLTIAR